MISDAFMSVASHDVQSLGRLDGLDDGLVVVLVNLLIDGGGHLLVALRTDMLLRDGSALVLVDAGLMLIVMRHEG